MFGFFFSLSPCLSTIHTDIFIGERTYLGFALKYISKKQNIKNGGGVEGQGW